MASDKATARVAALIKAKSNSRCFDCAAPGASTQAVLAPLGIFVCTTCGGIHRELQHRVKGVSMSAFKDEEADFLEAHGNKAARGVWLAHFDAAQHAPLDKIAGAADKMRPFIKMVFEERLFHSENPSNRGKPRPVEGAGAGAGAGAGSKRGSSTGGAPAPPAPAPALPAAVEAAAAEAAGGAIRSGAVAAAAVLPRPSLPGSRRPG